MVVSQFWRKCHCSYDPIGSMYGIFTYIYNKNGDVILRYIAECHPKNTPRKKWARIMVRTL